MTGEEAEWHSSTAAAAAEQVAKQSIPKMIPRMAQALAQHWNNKPCPQWVHLGQKRAKVALLGGKGPHAATFSVGWCLITL